MFGQPYAWWFGATICFVVGAVLGLARLRKDRFHTLKKVSSSKVLLSIEEGSMLSAVLSSSMDAVVTVDEGQIIVQFNSAAEEIFGYSKQEIVGLPWATLGIEFSNGDVPLPGALPATGRRVEGRAVKKNGRAFDIEFSSATSVQDTMIFYTAVIRDLTATKLTKSELKRSEERYRAFIQQSSKGIWRAELERPVSIDLPVDEQIEQIVATAKFAEYNQSLIRIFGYASPDSLIGKGIEAVLPITNEGGRDFLRSFIQANYHVSDIEGCHHDQKGNSKYLLDSLVGTVVGGKLVLLWGTHRDVTSHRETEQALKLRSHVLENMTEGVCITTEEGIIVYTNPTEDMMFGYARGELMGRHLSARNAELGEEGQQAFAAIIEHVKHHGSWRGEFVNQRKDRSIFTSYTRVTVVSLGEKIFWVWVQEDITEKKQLFEAERFAREEAERASRLKDEFLATLSHELRTPLNAILGWTQLCRPNKSTAVNLSQGLDVIERNARIQAQIIEDLLDMNRIISGKIRLDVQSTDLPQVIQDSLESVRPAANAKEIKITAAIPPFVKSVLVDPERLQQVLWNLLSNAVKFTPHGGKINVTLHFAEHEVEILVSDTGDGIEQEFLPYVFDRFRQADASMARRHGGLGLGLAIVRQLVELHGGRVEARSGGRGKGTTFIVTLPVIATRYDQRFAPKKATVVFEDQITSLQGRKILVVDDQPDAQELVKRLLEECGAEVETAGSAKEGLEMLRVKKPEVLISDIGMPELDGFEFMRQVRKLPQGEGGMVAAVALTAFARAEDKILALEAGYQMHLAKPVEPAELVQVVSTVLGSSVVA